MTADDIPPFNDVLEVAGEAARSAGAVLAKGFYQPKSIKFKGEIDLVTEYDVAAERVIVDKISSVYPDHRIVAEESGERGSDSPCRWYVDPLDGTTNFAHGVPIFAVSIAFEVQTPDGPEICAGVVFDPLRGEMFTAAKGQQAFLNEQPITVSDQDDPGRALMATGIPYYVHQRPDPALSRFRHMTLAAQGVRRLGSAALDLAYVAAGRFDGFWEEGLWPWDTAAGIILVLEAGGTVTDMNGGKFQVDAKEILATNGCLHYNMLTILTAGYPEPVKNPASPKGGR